ncbi:tripartite tricarboxylate transporter substrate binding protein [Pseudomonas sp. GOM7]|uniref:Bug family tripartite tricarboxylate transporter substrate binding protein n=1 Tax=Pseudomonas sp. GOM7 TaxID=2998079 RepID=UPI00227D0D0E|nr:tripartite tricarboxylate transporter substrate binding protein [Pseudomonas sp. GOM7]WAJ37819.1 tripartite tricarboxylate transporter substrate binding protein [Pseudomonas sp. GOM7]
MIGKITRKLTASALFALAMSTLPAQADDYPQGNIDFIVPFPPGGGTDISARQLTQQISESTGWTFVVENRPGAGGNIGLAQLARAKADGLNLAIGQTSNLAVNPSLYKDIPYDPLKDFRQIAVISTQPMVIVTRSDSPIKDLPSFLADAKAEPGRLLFGTPGSGTVAHLSLELLQSKAGIELTHVPYPGIAQAISDVMGGVVDIYIGSMPSVLPHIRAGSLRPLAVTSAQRSPILANVPTVAESGFAGFETADWKAVVGPAGLSDERVAQLNKVINEALSSDKVRQAMEAEGSTVLNEDSAYFTNLLTQEIERWHDVIKVSGATVN